MFLRRKTKSARGAGYSYWHLCETVRTARGPRQRVVASLGKLDSSQCESLRDSWDDLESLLRGDAPAAKPRVSRVHTAPLPDFDEHAGVESHDAYPAASAGQAQPSRGWELGAIDAVRVERCRDFGECYLALSLWHRLGLDRLLAQLLPPGREAVRWRRRWRRRRMVVEHELGGADVQFRDSSDNAATLYTQVFSGTN